MKHIYLLACILNSGLAFTQSEPAKTKTKGLYIAWGYTRAVYSKSTLHLENRTGSGQENNYDFYLHDVTAHDRPNFEGIPDVKNITVPQYVVHIGYQVNKKFGFELNYDHTKYVVDDYQSAPISGTVNDHSINGTVVLDPDSFLHFEHSDGANFLLANVVGQQIIYNPGRNFQASWVLKAGAGIVIPRTDVTLYGHHLNNDWKVAGWITGIETGLRAQFYRHGFFEFVAKGCYADYVNAFVLGKHHGRASHHFFSGQLTATLGYQFGD
jgi:hypothetical protein